MTIKKAFFCAAIAASAFAAQAQNIVANGSFEQTVGSADTITNGWSIFSNIPNWTGNPNIEVRDSSYGFAQNGTNFVELDTEYRTNGTSNSAISQTINAAAGWYELSFWYSARINTGPNTNGLGFTFTDVASNSVVLSNSTLLDDTAGGSAHDWQQFKSGAIYLGGATALTFYARGTADTYGGSLDNVSVTAVPEPESLAMMLAGLGLMGTIARRRKQKAA